MLLRFASDGVKRITTSLQPKFRFASPLRLLADLLFASFIFFTLNRRPLSRYGKAFWFQLLYFAELAKATYSLRLILLEIVFREMRTALCFLSPLIRRFLPSLKIQASESSGWSLLQLVNLVIAGVFVFLNVMIALWIEKAIIMAWNVLWKPFRVPENAQIMPDVVLKPLHRRRRRRRAARYRMRSGRRASRSLSPVVRQRPQQSSNSGRPGFYRMDGLHFSHDSINQDRNRDRTRNNSGSESSVHSSEEGSAHILRERGGSSHSLRKQGGVCQNLRELGGGSQNLRKPVTCSETTTKRTLRGTTTDICGHRQIKTAGICGQNGTALYGNGQTKATLSSAKGHSKTSGTCESGRIKMTEICANGQNRTTGICGNGRCNTATTCGNIQNKTATTRANGQNRTTGICGNEQNRSATTTCTQPTSRERCSSKFSAINMPKRSYSPRRTRSGRNY